MGFSRATKPSSKVFANSIFTPHYALISQQKDRCASFSCAFFLLYTDAEKASRHSQRVYRIVTAYKLTVAELADWGFPHPLPSHLSVLQPDILEELFCAADRALTAQYGVGIMKS